MCHCRPDTTKFTFSFAALDAFFFNIFFLFLVFHLHSSLSVTALSCAAAFVSLFFGCSVLAKGIVISVHYVAQQEGRQYAKKIKNH